MVRLPERERERERERKKKVNLFRSSSFLKLYHLWFLDSLAGFLLSVFLRYQTEKYKEVSSATPCTSLLFSFLFFFFFFFFFLILLHPTLLNF
jgi:hypothetical protein